LLVVLLAQQAVAVLAVTCLAVAELLMTLHTH
jgi:hypothetical protein